MPEGRVENHAAATELILAQVGYDDVSRLARDLLRARPDGRRAYVVCAHSKREGSVVAEHSPVGAAPIARVGAALNGVGLLIFATDDEVSTVFGEARAARDGDTPKRSSKRAAPKKAAKKKAAPKKEAPKSAAKKAPKKKPPKES